VCYLLEGSAHVEIADEKFEMRTGDACFFPADQPHLFRATSDKVRVMVIYSPPYLENPANVRR
jgi:mannose-6-phosphate isomerase-like protein (cupin superfamily)